MSVRCVICGKPIKKYTIHCEGECAELYSKLELGTWVQIPDAAAQISRWVSARKDSGAFIDGVTQKTVSMQNIVRVYDKPPMGVGSDGAPVPANDLTGIFETPEDKDEEPIPKQFQCVECEGPLGIDHDIISKRCRKCLVKVCDDIVEEMVDEVKAGRVPTMVPVGYIAPEEMVDHPKHYNSHPSGVECIDIIRPLPFNIANAIKYLWRQGLKGDAVEDLRKAIWHIEDEIKWRENSKL